MAAPKSGLAAAAKLALWPGYGLESLRSEFTVETMLRETPGQNLENRIVFNIVS